ncbi:prospero homeobox protein 2 [Ochotona princeps]|uniref:prospero homeobox protein 2 n=1 Tax=Ochotona princeps TaxID=9978 RepID=UPI0027152428|nr:prospero homeobox protein 2 [Ochotona princeps]
MEGEQSPLPPELGEDGPLPWSLVRSSGLARPDGLWDEHIQAKRARVETIVRGMCLSPQPLVPGDACRARGGPACLEKARAHRRKQNIPAHQGPLRSGAARKAGPRAAEQLRGQLPHLQEHSGQVAGPQHPAGSNKAKGPGSGQQQPACCRPVPWSVDGNHGHGAGRNRSRVEKYRAAAVQCLSEPSFPPPGTQALLERLREELPGAVSQAVDAVLQKILLDPLRLPAQWDRNFQVLVPRGRREPSPPGTGVHPESLALAALPRRVQLQAGVPWGDWPMAKPLESPHHPGSSSSTPMPYQAPPAECPLAGPSYIQESQLLGQLLSRWTGSVRQRSPFLSHPSSESVLAPWEAAPQTSSVPNQQQQRPLPVTATSLGRLPFLPKVRMEQRHLPAVTEAPAFAPGRISFNCR